MSAPNIKFIEDFTVDHEAINGLSSHQLSYAGHQKRHQIYRAKAPATALASDNHPSSSAYLLKTSHKSDQQAFIEVISAELCQYLLMPDLAPSASLVYSRSTGKLVGVFSELSHNSKSVYDIWLEKNRPLSKDDCDLHDFGAIMATGLLLKEADLSSANIIVNQGRLGRWDFDCCNLEFLISSSERTRYTSSPVTADDLANPVTMPHASHVYINSIVHEENSREGSCSPLMFDRGSASLTELEQTDGFKISLYKTFLKLLWLDQNYLTTMFSKHISDSSLLQNFVAVYHDHYQNVLHTLLTSQDFQNFWRHHQTQLVTCLADEIAKYNLHQSSASNLQIPPSCVTAEHINQIIQKALTATPQTVLFPSDTGPKHKLHDPEQYASDAKRLAITPTQPTEAITESTEPQTPSPELPQRRKSRF